MRKDYNKKAGSIAVLASGGLDSAVLLAWASRRCRSVLPLFVAAGLRWEAPERRALGRFLRAARLPGVLAPAELNLGGRELYDPHWALPGGGAVPGRRAAWDSVHLPGRNLLLLSKAAVLCSTRGIPAVALGILRGNPFPDARPGFLKALETAAAAALGRRVRLLAPFRGLRKEAVIGLGRGLPLGLTLSCVDPRGGGHCGRCTKCHERRRAFRLAGAADPTRYRR